MRTWKDLTKPAVALLIALALPGCIATWRLAGGPQAPAAEGVVKTKIGKNGNTQLQIRVRHLAPPDKVATDAHLYLVWVQGITPETSLQNMGVLRVDKNLNGILETVTPLRRFDVIITPEAEATLQSPTNAPVLRTQVQIAR